MRKGMYDVIVNKISTKYLHTFKIKLYFFGCFYFFLYLELTRIRKKYCPRRIIDVVDDDDDGLS